MLDNLLVFDLHYNSFTPCFIHKKTLRLVIIVWLFIHCYVMSILFFRTFVAKIYFWTRRVGCNDTYQTTSYRFVVKLFNCEQGFIFTFELYNNGASVHPIFYLDSYITCLNFERLEKLQNCWLVFFGLQRVQPNAAICIVWCDRRTTQFGGLSHIEGVEVLNWNGFNFHLAATNLVSFYLNFLSFILILEEDYRFILIELEPVSD